MLISKDLTKEYLSGSAPIAVLRNVSLEIPEKSFVAITGPSGSGKTTLLGLLAGLDTPTSGNVILDGTEITTLSENERARLRGQKVGFVFQSFQLIPTLTALENVMVPLELKGDKNAKERAQLLLEQVRLADRMTHLPAQLSGGEQQRVALARAFSNSPKVLFADEPTGNLDNANGRMVIDLIDGLNREAGTTIVMVTHESHIAARAHRIISLSDGMIVNDTGSTP